MTLNHCYEIMDTMIRQLFLIHKISNFTENISNIYHNKVVRLNYLLFTCSYMPVIYQIDTFKRVFQKSKLTCYEYFLFPLFVVLKDVGRGLRPNKGKK